MRYEWDEAKNLANRRKHDGISFELATLVFEDEHCLVYLDRADSKKRKSSGGTRSAQSEWNPVAEACCLLFMRTGRTLMVKKSGEHVNGREIIIPPMSSEPVIRIVSARAAEKHEIGRYRQAAMD